MKGRLKHESDRRGHYAPVTSHQERRCRSGIAGLCKRWDERIETCNHLVPLLVFLNEVVNEEVRKGRLRRPSRSEEIGRAGAWEGVSESAVRGRVVKLGEIGAGP